MEFFHGALAAMGAALFTNPLDVLKTRMQLQGELKGRGQHIVHYRHMFQATLLIVKKEGMLALQKGLSSTLLTQAVRNGIKLGTYQVLTDRGHLCDNQNKTIFVRSLLASAFSGALGAFFSVPLYKATIRLQSRACEDIAVGHQHGHKTMTQAITDIYARHGIPGLWRGANAVMIRSIVGASAQLTSFTQTKEALEEYEIFKNYHMSTVLMASWIGGIVQVIFQTPFDVISVRLTNQHVNANGKGLLYNGMVNCIYKIVKSEGILAFYKGFGINYVKVGRHTTLYLFFWEILKDVHKKRTNKSGGCNEIGESAEM